MAVGGAREGERRLQRWDRWSARAGLARSSTATRGRRRRPSAGGAARWRRPARCRPRAPRRRPARRSAASAQQHRGALRVADLHGGVGGGHRARRRARRTSRLGSATRPCQPGSTAKPSAIRPDDTSARPRTALAWRQAEHVVDGRRRSRRPPRGPGTAAAARPVQRRTEPMQHEHHPERPAVAALRIVVEHPPRPSASASRLWPCWKRVHASRPMRPALAGRVAELVERGRRGAQLVARPPRPGPGRRRTTPGSAAPRPRRGGRPASSKRSRASSRSVDGASS